MLTISQLLHRRRPMYVYHFAMTLHNRCDARFLFSRGFWLSMRSL